MEGQAAAESRIGNWSRKPINSLADKAYSILEEMIVTLKLPPGSLISEAELSSQINIGRTPVREALQRLAKDRLISVLPRRGMIVSDIKILDQLEYVEMRRVTDQLVASKAASRLTPQQRTRFREIAVEIERAAAENDIQQFMHLDGEFDHILQTASRNAFASQVSEILHTHCRRFWFVHQGRGDLKRSARLHADMIEAVASGDAAEAIVASNRLSDYVEEFTRSAVDHA